MGQSESTNRKIMPIDICQEFENQIIEANILDNPMEGVHINKLFNKDKGDCLVSGIINDNDLYIITKINKNKKNAISIKLFKTLCIEPYNNSKKNVHVNKTNNNPPPNSLPKRKSYASIYNNIIDTCPIVESQLIETGILNIPIEGSHINKLLNTTLKECKISGIVNDNNDLYIFTKINKNKNKNNVINIKGFNKICIEQYNK